MIPRSREVDRNEVIEVESLAVFEDPTSGDGS